MITAFGPSRYATAMICLPPGRGRGRCAWRCRCDCWDGGWFVSAGERFRTWRDMPMGHIAMIILTFRRQARNDGLAGVRPARHGACGWLVGRAVLAGAAGMGAAARGGGPGGGL